MKNIFLFISFLISISAAAQKKPLDHSVYDSWESFGEKRISNNGEILVYAINPQEGDGKLYVKNRATDKTIEIPRGYNAAITPDGNFIICKIKPTYKETRDAKIKKKKADEMPKDTLAIIKASDLSIEKIARVKNYKLPKESSEWLAWQTDNPADDKKNEKKDSTSKQPKLKLDELFLHNLSKQTTDSFNNVSEYHFAEKGNSFVYEKSANKKDSTDASVHYFNLNTKEDKAIFRLFADAKNFTFNEEGNRLAFVANKDTSSKAAYKFYDLYYYNVNDNAAQKIADRFNKSIPEYWTISENANLEFSKNADRILFGTAPVLPIKDTSLPEFERVHVDVWSYKDDYLQSVQLKNIDTEIKKSYTAVYDVANAQITQYGNENTRNVITTKEGDGVWFYTVNDSGYRAASQWQGFSYSDVYAVNTLKNVKNIVQKKFRGNVYPSYTGKYLLMYDEVKRKYFCYNAATNKLVQVAKDIKYALYDEDNDVPDDPGNYGVEMWTENDEWVLINDRYDIWAIDPLGIKASENITMGRPAKLKYDIVRTDADVKFLEMKAPVVFRVYNEQKKYVSYHYTEHLDSKEIWPLTATNTSVLANGLIKAKNSFAFLYTKENYEQSPVLYYNNEIVGELQLATTNQQQKNYKWGTAELFKWTAYTGKLTEGILYKPENFNPKKKYPMIVYFYERNNQTLHQYIAPSPTPSRLNISFFVSRGYVVFVPDIWYVKGKPGQSAYDYILSGTRALIKKGFIDSTRIGLQGQSWGGYQTAYLITKTNLYKAAWAGAPVANMFSAYGGIRWGSGMNRQFQYERSQSRIGATIWQRPDLYIENSPLFHLPKVKTPLVIMHNDNDGAVPWYQGIELFTAMRRLNKPVWMLNYNGEEHNLMERKNRKDIQKKEQEFFDWLLMDSLPASWIDKGVSAVMKGRELQVNWNDTLPKTDTLKKVFKQANITDSIIGKWQLKELVGKEISQSEKLKTYTFSKDGSFEYKSEQRTITGKYYFVEYTNEVRVITDDKVELLFKITSIDNNTIKIEDRIMGGAAGIAVRTGV